MEMAIIHTALEALTDQTGIGATWKQGRTGKNKNVDGFVRLIINRHQQELPVEVKNRVVTANLPGLFAQKEKLGQLLVLAEHILPKHQEELKGLGIFFLDTAGNAYIHKEGFYILIEGKKPTMKVATDARTFSNGGLKVIFQLLLNEALLKGTVREIAAAAKVSLDTAHKTMTGLKAMQYLLPLKKEEWIWHNKTDLLKRWITEYDTRLKPGQFIQRFDFLHEKDFDNWKKIKFKDGLTCWGGEPAGELLTGNLKPKELTLYTQQSTMELIQQLRIVPRASGAIAVYRRFWPEQPVKKMTVPPLLAYADLVNTGERRNIEIAQTIYEQYLQDQFQTATPGKS